MGIVRNTKSIKIILDEFDKHSTAMSVITLVERLSSALNKTTIYRVLDKLEDDGRVHSFLGKNGHKWYAQCADCSVTGHHDTHPHFQCSDCGKVDCLPTEIKIPQIPNRRIDTSQVLLQGQCEECTA